MQTGQADPVRSVPKDVAAHPRGSCRLGRSRIHPVDGRWRRWLSGSDDLAARPEPAHRGREGRPDPGLVGAGAGVDGAGGGAGSAAAPAAQDAEQLQPAAIQGPQGEPAGGGAARRAAPGQPGSGRRWPRLGRGARPARDRQGGGVRERGARIGWLVLRGAGWRRRAAPPLILDATVPFKLNQDRRHRIPRQRHKVANWREYDASLRQRGSLTVWFTDEAVAAWGAGRRPTPGGPPWAPAPAPPP